MEFGSAGADRGLLKEFEAIIAVVIGGAFAVVIASFTEDILTPIIGAIFGQETDFSRLAIDIGDQQITYGNFINAIITFLIVAFALFLVVRAYNAMKGPDEDDGPSEVDLLTDIRDALQNR